MCVVGLPLVYHGIEYSDALHYSSLISEYYYRIQQFIESQHTNINIGTLQNIRIHTIKYELIVNSDTDYILLVIQKQIQSAQNNDNISNIVDTPVEQNKDGDNDEDVVDGDSDEV